MATNKIHKIKSISEFHRLYGLPEPEHPLISVINLNGIDHSDDFSIVIDFYSISIKRGLKAKFKYGQQAYDFDSGVMFFISPNQVYGKVEVDIEDMSKASGWILLVHPDFFWNTSLAKNIRQYEYFDYTVNEALFLSEKEEKLLIDILQNIQQEYHSNIDKYSKNIIISHIEALLNYAERYYNRQFITREKANHQILEGVEALLTNYFNNEKLMSNGLPTVQLIAGQLNISPKYLSNILRLLTGQNTQQHIHEKLIAKAKEKLSTTDLSISEIAYDLGFEHLQSFSKLFKSKTNLSPLAFRKSFK